MYQVDDTIMYGTQGVCKIDEITEKEFMGMKKEYYILKPIGDDGSTIFVPVQNLKLREKMRKILSKTEIYDLVRSISQKKTEWTANENARKEKYKKIIIEGNHAELIKMVKELYDQKAQREQDGKKLYLSDERFLREAERILYEEFRYVLDIKKEQMISFILGQI